MMGGKRGAAFRWESLLQEGWGTWVVVCPGIDGGGELRRTFRDSRPTPQLTAWFGPADAAVRAMRHNLTLRSASARNV